MKRSSLRLLLIIIAVAAFGLLINYLGLFDYITLATVQQHSTQFRDMVNNHYWLSASLYILSCILVVALALPIAIPLSLLGGFLFGVVWGTVYAVVGTTAGSIIYFTVIRYVMQALFKKQVSSNFERMKAKVDENGPYYLLLFHYSAIFPFVVINTLAALTTMRLSTFIGVTLLGTTPLSLLYAFAGRQLGSITKVGDIFSLEIILALVLLGLLACMPILIKKFKGSVGDE